MELFRIGILGAGRVAAKMAATLRSMPGVEPYAVAARDLARAQAFAAEWGCRRAYGSYEALADDPRVQLVYIATPHSHHYAQARMCLLRDKAVLCEKAFTANARQAEALLALARERRVFIAEAVWTRYMPFSRTIADLVHSGAIGTPQMLAASLCYPLTHKERIVRPELGGGALLDIGVYPIHFASMLFGTEIEQVVSQCEKNELGVDMQETLSFRFAGGRMASLYASALCAGDRQGIVSGDKGYIIVDNINNPLEAVVCSENHERVARYAAPPQISGYEYEVWAAREAVLQGDSETPFLPHAETLRIMRLLDELRAAWGVRFPADDEPME